MARTRTLLDWLTLDQRSGQPLYRQIYEQIRTAVISGPLVARTDVPASRSLAASIGVSRITVLQAYDQLIAEGFLASRRGSGTRIASLFGDEAERRETIAASVYDERVDHVADPAIQHLPEADVSAGLAFQPGIPRVREPGRDAELSAMIEAPAGDLAGFRHQAVERCRRRSLPSVGAGRSRRIDARAEVQHSRRITIRSCEAAHKLRQRCRVQLEP